jgi:hypothetical protein
MSAGKKINPTLTLSLSISLLLFSLSQFSPAQKGLVKFVQEYQFSLVLSIVSFSVACILFGIYIGIKLSGSGRYRR